MLMFKFLIAVVMVFAARSALACSVTVIDTLKRTFQEADVVFVGRVVGVANFAATLEVTESLKGERRHQLVVSTASSCDFAGFEVGKIYLVLAKRDGETLHASLGSHTTQLTAKTHRRVQLVRQRAAWWQSPPSRFAPLRALSFMWRSIRQSAIGLVDRSASR